MCARVRLHRHSRPDPGIYCFGLWQEFIVIDGVECRLDLLGEYADQFLYYVSGRRVSLKGRHDEIAVAQRSIFSTECLGHALDRHDRLMSSRTCLKCTELKNNRVFRKMLLQAQNPKRFDPSSKLPNRFYSWKQLEVS